MDADALRQLIRQRIQDGRLPRDDTLELAHGHGIGQVCDGCGAEIARDQSMTVRIDRTNYRTIRLHDECFRIWDAERLL